MSVIDDLKCYASAYPRLYDFCNRHHISCNIEEERDFMVFRFRWKAYAFNHMLDKHLPLHLMENTLIEYIQNFMESKNDVWSTCLRERDYVIKDRGDYMYTTKKEPAIVKVIFNKPATIVYWADGTKTVVKCQDGDEFNKEVGLAMAVCKKALGNKPNYNNWFKKMIKGATDANA